MSRKPLLVALAVAGPLVLPASASADAVCRVHADVAFDAAGRFAATGPGAVRCAGRFGRITVSPGEAEASISGTARTGATACLPLLEGGQLQMHPREMFGLLRPLVLDVAVDWTALGRALAGTARFGSRMADIAGDVRFTPAGSACPAAGFVPGRIEVEVLVHTERPQPAAPDGPIADPPSKAKKSKPRSRKPCRRARGKSRKAKRRAARTCRRARARRRA